MELDVGTRVRLTSTGEVGVVIHGWWDQDIQMLDYYIAFFGTEFPEGKPDQIPYVLRYAGMGLELIEADA